LSVVIIKIKILMNKFNLKTLWIIKNFIIKIFIIIILKNDLIAIHYTAYIYIYEYNVTM